MSGASSFPGPALAGGGSAGDLALKLWELDDDQLEAELQRQLDGLGSDDEDGGQQYGSARPPPPRAAASPRLPHKADKGAPLLGSENVAHSANGLGPAVAGVKDNTSAPDVPEGDAGGGSAWAELMASMTAEQDHWSEYESELAVLRTSMAEYTVTQPQASQWLGEHADPTASQKDDHGAIKKAATDAADDDAAAAAAAAAAALEDPDKMVQDIRDRVNALMSDDEDADDADAADDAADDADDAYDAGDTTIKSKNDASHNAATDTTTSETKCQNKISTRENPPAPTLMASSSPTALRQRALHLISTTNTSMDTLVSEAQNMMAPEEREWREASSAQDRALMEAMELQADERARMETWQAAERERMEATQQQKERDLERESKRRAAEIEERSRADAARRAEDEAALERQREEDRARMDALRKALEEAALDQERAMEEARREEQARQRQLTRMRVRWALEERSASTIQKHFAAHTMRKVEQAKAERMEVERRAAEELQRKTQENLENAAALTMQRVARGKHARGLVRSVREQRTQVALYVQRLARGVATRGRINELRAQRETATMKIQRAARGKQGRKRARRARESKAQRAGAQRIQMWWRCAWLRRSFLEHRSAATVLGGVWRSKLVRMDLASKHRAAAALQSVFRGHTCRQSIKAPPSSARNYPNTANVWDGGSADLYYDEDGLNAEAEDDDFEESFDLFPGRTITEIPETARDDTLLGASPPSASYGSSSLLAKTTTTTGTHHHGQKGNDLPADGSAAPLAAETEYAAKEAVSGHGGGIRGRVFPPSNEDQVLCKQNQRKHMAQQRRRWMAQRAAILSKNETHATNGPAAGTGTREEKSKDKSDDQREETTAAAPTAFASSAYSEWIDRAVTWQTIFSQKTNSKTSGARGPGSFELKCFDIFPEMKKPTSSSSSAARRAHAKAVATHAGDREKALAERKENKHRARQLKQELIDLGQKLRTMRDEGDSIDHIQSLVGDMKRMKEEYQSLATTVARQKEDLASAEKAWQQQVQEAEASFRDSDDNGAAAARFESSVECLAELPLGHFGELQNLACIVANCNKIAHVNGLAEVVPELRSLSLRDNCISDRGLADVAVLAASSLEHLCVEMNQISSLEAIVVGAESLGDTSIATRTPSQSLLRALLASNNKISDLSPLCGDSVTGAGANKAAAPFPYLERLSMYRNSVQWIPRELTLSLKWLRHLDLGRNELMTLDGVHFGYMPLLQGLILYENRIADDTLPALHNVLLKELWLNGNRLKELRFHGDGSWVPSLESLHVHDNSIRTLSSLASMPFVRSIDASFNQIEEIEELSHLRACPYVEVFRCNDNPVAEHPDYRSKVLLAFPRLREFDGEAVTSKHHSEARQKVYGAQSHVVEAWLDHADFTSALRRHDLGVDWHEALRCAGANGAVAAAADGDLAYERGEAAAWQAFEAMCRRHRAARDEMARGHRRAIAEGKELDGSGLHRGKARGMERTFQQDREMRRLLISQLKEHWGFGWNGTTHDRQNSVMDAKHASLIRGGAARDAAGDARYYPVELSHALSQKAAEAERMSSRSGARSRSGSSSSLRPNSRMTAAASAAVMFQCLYRGYCARHRMVESRRRRGKVGGDFVGGGVAGRGGGGGDEDEEEFRGVDLDSFMGFGGIGVFEQDEFDIMQANADPSASFDPPALPSSKSDVRTGAWDDGVASALFPPAGVTSYQQAAMQAAHYSAAADRYQEPPFSMAATPLHAMPVSDRPSCPPSPASCASSMGVGMQPGDMSMPGTPLAIGQDTPVYQRRYRQKVRAQEQRVEKVATEWGFEDKKTAQLMMMRQSRFQKAKRDKKRRAKLKDPEYKYKVLMRKVRDNMAKERDAGAGAGGAAAGSVSTPSSSRSSSRPSNSRSAVQRDRARHRKTRKVRLPAWASGEGSSSAGGMPSAGGSVENDSASVADMRLESAGSNVSSTPFKVVEWGPKDILPPI